MFRAAHLPAVVALVLALGAHGWAQTPNTLDNRRSRAAKKEAARASSAASCRRNR